MACNLREAALHPLYPFSAICPSIPGKIYGIFSGVFFIAMTALFYYGTVRILSLRIEKSIFAIFALFFTIICECLF